MIIDLTLFFTCVLLVAMSVAFVDAEVAVTEAVIRVLVICSLLLDITLASDLFFSFGFFVFLDVTPEDSLTLLNYL